MKLLGILLMPSWLSGLIMVGASLAVVFGSVALLHYNNSSWQLILPTQHKTTSTPLAGTGIEIPDSPNSTNILIDNLLLWIFWAGVGIIIYSFIVTIINVFTTVANLKQEANYVHANRRSVLRQAGGRLLFRSAVLIIWIIYINYYLHLLLPFTVALAYAGSGPLGWLYNTGYLIAAICLSIIILHIHTVLLRLLFLKPRLFGQIIKV